MDLIEVLNVTKWPAVVVAIAWLLRKPIGELIVNIADFTISKDGLSARIGRPKDIPKIEDKTITKQKEVSNGYVSKEKEGEVHFDYSNNDGVYTIGEGEHRFDTQWSKASKEFIHFYNDQPSIRTVRLAKDVTELDEVRPEKYDSSSRARTAGLGQIAIFENIQGKFLAVKVIGLKDDTRGDSRDEIHFKYKIL